MSNSLRSRIVECITQPTPAQVVSLFMALLVILIFLSMAGQFLWTVGGSLLIEALDTSLALIFCRDALGGPGVLVRHFPILTGALGVIWSFHIARRARSGANPGLKRWDALCFVVSMFFFVSYFVYLPDVLTYFSGFVAHVAFYSTVAVLSFYATHVVACLEDESDNDFSPFAVYAVGMIATFFGTGLAAPSVFSLQLQAVCLHIGAVVLGGVAYVLFLDAMMAQRHRQASA
ncbi:hypothetical protein KTD31_01450 [Burkholderia multivorans]|uniref:hypothetical protein n=1 Tax=Burkholderia multivorans TaxID=87883 RepID=UPI001C24F9D4|nr:hypothetical protein [Burkholderia multivorans]MBU9200067.1 hypothetical protein [Burkholderia multivorans]MDN8078813.1 hypothetical protein [Burkholderia multivorans]